MASPIQGIVSCGARGVVVVQEESGKIYSFDMEDDDDDDDEVKEDEDEEI